MPTSLFQYEMLPTTWFYLSSIIILATFFRFNRFFSVRNLDIIGLIAFAPGLLLISMNREYMGFAWLFAVGILVFFRLLLDVFMVRRPLLEPNLAISGVIFSCVTLLAFFIPNLLINRGDRLESPRTVRLDQLLTTQSEYARKIGKPDPIFENPGYRPFYLLSWKAEEVLLPSKEVKDQILSETILAPAKKSRKNRIGHSPIPTFVRGEIASKVGALIDVTPEPEGDLLDESFISAEGMGEDDPSPLPTADSVQPEIQPLSATPTIPSQNPLTVLSDDEEEGTGIAPLDEAFLILFIFLGQFGVVFGLIMVGHCHFGNLKTGLAAVMVYLLLPYVNQMPGSLEAVIPGALLVLAVAIYHRPIFSGFLIGLAGSFVFYPFFLLPLWIGFYLKRGLYRFIIGVLSSVFLMGILLMFSPTEFGTYAEQLAAMFGQHSMFLITPTGLWEFVPTYYRIPTIALFMVICFGLALWPSQKNLATLISCSTLVMLGVQFWMGNQGGLYMGWYLPLLILTLFRPNLEDRVASTTVIEI